METRVAFTKIKDQIISNLKKASKEIKVAVAWLTDEDIIRTLIQRAEAGVSVEIVMSDSKENFRNTLKFKEFLRIGGKLHIATPRFLHHKFCILDRNTIINGSYNWTYFAQSNEENILIISLDSNHPEDSKLLTAFESKHRFYCDKASIQVKEIGELNQFKEQGKVAAVIFAQIDEEEIRLRQELEDDVTESLNKAISIGINVSPLLLERMKLDGGGVEFIKRILHDEMTSGEMKSGFRKLEEPIPHRVDLSLEYLASRPKYSSLFSREEIQFCTGLMHKYNL